jgi:zinc-ribbon domain
MAGFCRNCGSPLDDGQGFCARCGTPASGPPVRSTAPSSSAPSSAPRPETPPEAAPQSRPPAPAPPAQAAAAAPSKSGSTLVKVLLIFLVVIFIFGAAGVAGVWYVAHRVNQKVHEIGLDDLSTASNANRGPALGRIDPCSLLSKADVGQAAKVEVIRAEADPGSEPGCVYNVQGDISDLVARHASLLHKEATTEAQRQQFESVAKGLFQGMNTDESGSASKHPGEAPVFTFSVTNSGAKAQMNLSRMTFSRLGGGMVTIPDLGDDNLDIGGAMMLVRKGDKLIRVLYMMCPCATDDVVPLVKKLIANM